MSPTSLAAALADDPAGRVRWHGRIATASNLTLLGELDDVGLVVHKPVRGERPLWDYPEGTLADREVAAWLVADRLGLDLVPETAWVDDLGLGPGSVQRWFGPSPLVDAGAVPGPEGLVDVVDAERLDELEAGGDVWHVVVEGLGEGGDPVWLVHREDARLRRLALFDALINNSDRKGGHVLTHGGELRGIDHGVSFSRAPKLRTVLWGWAGRPFTATEQALVERAATITDELAGHLTDDECAAWQERTDELARHRRFPVPGEDWPAVPWPPF